MWRLIKPEGNFFLCRVHCKSQRCPRAIVTRSIFPVILSLIISAPDAIILSGNGRSEKRLKREMASDTPPHDGKERLEALEGDLAYVSFYPKDRKYVGLFTVRGAEDARTAKRRAEARKLALAAAAAAAGASSSSSSSEDESDGEDAFADDAGEASDGEASGDFFLAA